MRREVDSSCKLWMLIAAGGHEKLAWESWIKNELHSTNRTTGKSLCYGTYIISFPQPNLALTSSPLSNTVKKGNVKFLNQWAHKSELRETYLHFVEISIFIHSRVKFLARDDWHFDNKLPTLWLDNCSLKEDSTWERTSALYLRFWRFCGN